MGEDITDDLIDTKDQIDNLMSKVNSIVNEMIGKLCNDECQKPKQVELVIEDFEHQIKLFNEITAKLLEQCNEENDSNNTTVRSMSGDQTEDGDASREQSITDNY